MTRGAVLVFLNTVSADTLGLIIAAAGASSLTDNNGSLFSLAGVVWHRASVASFACASAHLLRRHLMVWAIFAPKLLFETLFFFVTIGAVVCVEIFSVQGVDMNLLTK
jgi:hypothetical protein